MNSELINKDHKNVLKLYNDLVHSGSDVSVSYLEDDKERYIFSIAVNNTQINMLVSSTMSYEQLAQIYMTLYKETINV